MVLLQASVSEAGEWVEEHWRAWQRREEHTLGPVKVAAMGEGWLGAMAALAMTAAGGGGAVEVIVEGALELQWCGDLGDGGQQPHQAQR